MPKIGETSTVSNFGFSKQRLADFNASEYTLVEIFVDSSGSISGHENAVEAAIANVIESCRKSPRAANLLIRVVTFGSNITVIHESKLLKEIVPDEYRATIRPFGMTCLRDAAVNMYSSIAAAADDLRKNDYEVNAIGFIITDGDDTCSKHGPQAVASAAANLLSSEAVDSYRSVIISINNSSSHFQSAMAAFAASCGFDQVIDAGNADPQSLAKLAEFVSASISSQSSSLGTGAPSQPVSF